jgi:2-deoxy-D-gluconate 3-dehydrogenase
LANAISPGKILTGAPEEADPEVHRRAMVRTPFFRLGRPSDIAGAALFLAGDDSSYISGANLAVDGGWLAY